MAARTGRILTSHRAIEEAVSSAGSESKLLVSGHSARLDRIVSLARSAGVTVQIVSRAELRAIAPDAHDCALQLGNPPGGERRSHDLESLLDEPARASLLLLVLDHITDPHNYGAILRSADQFGVDAVVVPGRRSAPLSAVAIQASAGTAPHVPIVTVSNLVSSIELMKDRDVWVYAAEMGGEPVHRSNLVGRVAIVLGSEGKGVSRLVADRVDARVRIPMGGHADSLNVSVAAGVLLYEIRRQQGWLDAR